MNTPIATFADLDALAGHLRSELQTKKYILLYAYNGTGKTRLSMAFKNLGKHGDQRDTLYFNAFTEDLFTWDNDLNSDSTRVLRINATSRFFSGLEELAMEDKIRAFLNRYADFDFRIDYKQWSVTFSRTIANQTIDHIKVSRGEENIFIWCFFLAIVELAIDGDSAYNWVKYIYIDDPISSLDDNNAIAVAAHLANLIKKSNTIKTVISSHHTLFFNVLFNEIKTANKYFLNKVDIGQQNNEYHLRNTTNTPSFYHVAMLTELHKAAQNGQLYTYHFNILRSILEKTANFHGFRDFSDCIKQDEQDLDGRLHTRIVNILNHGNYSLYEPQEMLDENKQYFRKILSDFMQRYAFNPELFPPAPEEQP